MQKTTWGRYESQEYAASVVPETIHLQEWTDKLMIMVGTNEFDENEQCCWWWWWWWWRWWWQRAKKNEENEDRPRNPYLPQSYLRMMMMMMMMMEMLTINSENELLRWWPFTWMQPMVQGSCRERVGRVEGVQGTDDWTRAGQSSGKGGVLKGKMQGLQRS